MMSIKMINLWKEIKMDVTKENLEKQIAEMESKLKEMREELNKPKEFEWSYTNEKTFLVNPYSIQSGVDGSSPTYLTHGRYRKTRENAERALERNRVANRLEALVEQIDPEWVAD